MGTGKKILFCRKHGGLCETCMMADWCPRYQDTGLETPVIDTNGNIVSYDSPTSIDYDDDGVMIEK